MSTLDDMFAALRGATLFRDRPSYDAYKRSAPESFALLADPPSRGFCPLCELSVRFAHPTTIRFAIPDRSYQNLREGFICPRCHMMNRQRLLGYAVKGLGRGRDRPFQSPYIAEVVSPLHAWMRSRLPGLIGSEYLGPGKVGGRSYPVVVPGAGIVQLRHEDLTALSYETGSKDLVITCDVLEHVPDYNQALRELRRILQDGGLFLSSFPFVEGNDSTLERARVLPDGSVEHRLPPEIHGNPLSPDGALAFHSFGWNLLEAYRRAGFADAAVLHLFSLDWGFCHNNAPIADLFMGPLLVVGIA